jgi:hypothetical protein
MRRRPSGASRHPLPPWFACPRTAGEEGIINN